MCARYDSDKAGAAFWHSVASQTRQPEMATRCLKSMIRWRHCGWDSGVWSHALSQPTRATNFGRPKQVAALAIALPLRQSTTSLPLTFTTRLNRHRLPISCHRSGLSLPVRHVLKIYRAQYQGGLTDLSFRGTLNTNWSCLSYLVSVSGIALDQTTLPRH